MDASFDLMLLPDAARRALERQHQGLREGGLPCGSAVADADGHVIAEGHNHAYQAATGANVLEGTPIAHAEINALARVSTTTDASTLTLWSTQQPCPMCAVACAFVGIGAVRWLAPDPAGEIEGFTEPGPANGELALDGAWARAANVVFLAGIARIRGPEHSTVRGYAAIDARVSEVAVQIAVVDELVAGSTSDLLAAVVAALA